MTTEATERIDWSQIRTHAESLLFQANQPPSGDPSLDPNLEIFNGLITEQLRAIQRVDYGARAPLNAGYWTRREGAYEFTLERMAIDGQGSPTDRLTDRHINCMVVHWYDEEKPSLSLQIVQEERSGLPLLHSITISNPQKTAVFPSLAI